MKRYICHLDHQKWEPLSADVVIVGTGIAGLYTALQLDPKLSCVLLNKNGVSHSDSMYAQGGVAAVEESESLDSLAQKEKHYADTLVAGAGLCDKSAVRVLVEEAWENIEELLRYDVPFDRSQGRFLLTREGGHSESRVLHCGGDATGKFLTERLLALVVSRPNIKVFDNMVLCDIVTANDVVVGVTTLDDEDTPCYFSTSKVVIATGGIGQIYEKSTNDRCLSGDGITVSHRAGATLKDMEFIQFHPTAFLYPDESGRYFLISESLRGEGAVLRNGDGEAFMADIHPLKDLAPRDIVARAIHEEMKKEGRDHVYLDITQTPSNVLKERFPTIYGACLAKGIDMSKDWIPVLPVQHYFMGGIKTDLNGQTNIKGLYSCGEAACTGVHGANRLASNSLLECLVFGRRCARHINHASFSVLKTRLRMEADRKKENDVDFAAYDQEIRSLMSRYCGIIRNGRDLNRAATRMAEIETAMGTATLLTPAAIEAYHKSLVAKEILAAALKRKQSVGAHYRSDEEITGENQNEPSL